MKVAIQINNLNELANWQMRVMEALFSDSIMHFCAVFVVPHSGLPKPPGGISKQFNKLQFGVESKLFKASDTIWNKNVFYGSLNNVKHYYINPNENDVIDSEIKALNIDLILHLDVFKPSMQLANYATNGIWWLNHGQTDKSPIGFSEIISETSGVWVTLEQYANNALIRVDQARFNRHWSLLKTTNSVLESAVALLLKNLQLWAKKELVLKDVNAVSEPLEAMGVVNYTKYLSRFYKQLFVKTQVKFEQKLLKKRHQCFTLFFADNAFLNTDLNTLNPIELPKGEFWADPFLFEHNEECYVFFENYPYKTKRGKISCGKLVDGKVIDVVDVLTTDFHLSYPYVFKEDNEIYMMPESSENKNLVIYKCISFPDKWEAEITAFKDEAVVDASFYTDKNQDKWLFVNKADHLGIPLENELHIYKYEDIKSLDKAIPHKQNPVIIDASVARNGGAIFSYDGDNYRPSQANNYGFYGRALNINKIVKLSLNEYQEELVQIIEPDFYDGLMAVHHLHQIKDKFVIDAAYKKI